MKNKKLVILSSSIAGIGLAAGALSASCSTDESQNNAAKNSQEDSQKVSARDLQAVAASVSVSLAEGKELSKEVVEAQNKEDFVVEAAHADAEHFTFSVKSVTKNADSTGVVVVVTVTAKNDDQLTKEVSQTLVNQDLVEANEIANIANELESLNPAINYPYKERVYLPSESVNTLKSEVELSWNNDEAAKKATIELVSVSVNSEDVTKLNVEYRLYSRKNSAVAVTKTAEVSGFKSALVQYANEVSRLESLNLVVDYKNKAEVTVDQANNEGVLVEGLVDATAKVVEVLPKLAGESVSLSDNTVMVKVELTSTTAQDAPAVVREYTVSGFKQLSESQHATRSKLEEVVHQLKFKPVLTEETKTPLLAINKYKATSQYADIFTVEGLPEGVTFTVEGEPRTLSTHPETLLVVYTLTKMDEATEQEALIRTRVDVREYNNTVPAAPKPAEEPAKPVEEEKKPEPTDAEKLAAKKVAELDRLKKAMSKMILSPRLESAENDYIVDKRIDKISKPEHMLPSVYVEEYNAEAAKKENHSEFLKTLADSVLSQTWAQDANNEDIKIESITLSPKNDAGLVVATVKLSSLKEGLTDVNHTAELNLKDLTGSKDAKFLTTEKAVQIQKVVKNQLEEYKVNKDGLKFEDKDKVNLAPVTNVLAFDKTYVNTDGKTEEEVAKLRETKAKEYQQNIKLIKEVSGFVKTDLQGEDNVQPVTGAELKELIKAAKVEGYEIEEGVDVSLMLEVKNTAINSVTSEDGTGAVQTGRVQVYYVVNAFIPGVGETQLESDKESTDHVEGFLSDQEEKRYRLLWERTANRYLSTRSQNAENVAYFVTKAGKEENARQTLTTLDVVSEFEKDPSTLERFKYTGDTKFDGKYNYVFADKMIDLVDGAEVEKDIFNDKTGQEKDLLQPKYQNLAIKLKVTNVSRVEELPEATEGRVRVQFTLVNPYHKDWQIIVSRDGEIKPLENQYIIRGFKAVKVKEQEVVDALVKLLNKYKDSEDKIVAVADYPNKNNVAVDKAVSADKAQPENKSKFTLSYKDGLDLNAFLDKNEKDTPDAETFKVLYDINLANYPVKEVGEALVSDDAKGIASVKFVIESKIAKDNNVKAEGTTEAYSVKGFKLTDAKEKERLNSLKTQFQYKGYVSTSQYNNQELEAAKTATESSQNDIKRSLEALRQINIEDAAKDLANYGEVAGYSTEGAIVRVLSVELVNAEDINNRDVKVKFELESTRNQGVKSDAMTYVFGGFRNKAEKAKQDKIDALNKAVKTLEYSYKGGDVEAAKVTAESVSKAEDKKEKFEQSDATKKALEALKATAEIVDVKLPVDSEGKELKGNEAIENDKVVLVVKLKDNEDQTLVSENHEVVVAGFKSLLKAEQERIAEAAKVLTAAIKELEDADKGKLLSDVAFSAKVLKTSDGVVRKSASNQNDASAPLVFEVELSELQKVVKENLTLSDLETQEVELVAYKKAVLNNTEGKVTVQYELKSTKEEFKNVESAKAEGSSEISGFLTQPVYDETNYPAELKRLNDLAAKTQKESFEKTDANSKLAVVYDGSLNYFGIPYTAKDFVGVAKDAIENQELSKLWSSLKIKQVEAGTELTDVAAEATVQVLAVNQGVKDTDIYVTFRLVSTKEGLKKYDGTKFTGVTSDVYQSKAVLLGLTTQAQKDLALELMREQDRDQLYRTKDKNWGSTIGADYVKEVNYSGIEAYNSSFQPVVNEDYKPLLDTLVGAENKALKAEDFEFLNDKGEVVELKDVTAAEVAGIRFKEDATSNVLASGRKAKVVYSKVQDLAKDVYNNVNSSLVWVKVKLGVEGETLESPAFLLKFDGAKTPQQKAKEDRQALLDKMNALADVELIAKYSNLRIEKPEEFVLEQHGTQENLPSKVKLHLGKSQQATNVKNQPWDTDAVKVAVNSTVDLTKETMTVVSKDTVQGSKDGVHLLGAKLSSDRNVSVVITNIEVVGTSSLLVDYKVTLLDEEGKATEVSATSRTLLENVRKEADLPKEKQVLEDIQFGSTEFTSSYLQEKTAAALVAKVKEVLTNLKSDNAEVKAAAQAELNELVKPVTQLQDQKVVVSAVEESNTNHSSVIVTYKVQSTLEGYLGTDKFESKEKYASIFKFKYEESKMSDVTNEKAPAAPAAQPATPAPAATEQPAAPATQPAAEPAQANESTDSQATSQAQPEATTTTPSSTEDGASGSTAPVATE
ncbi:hypothetical protein [Mycoplasma sp. Ms02]|uniref:hypothetical protein n=1 Tax=Mycoplasma sp. Ms02 TaxID=353851 RepID=UPI001C895FD3|nr:hypothetical protein [Mycoplasma sp. Ms02]QZE12197.1 hypothetical protein K4L35_02535 [Mycoplasma sp. Ms02]